MKITDILEASYSSLNSRRRKLELPGTKNITDQYITTTEYKNKVRDFIAAKTPIAYNSAPIYRGMVTRDEDPLYFINPNSQKHEPRKSANTSNYYTVLIDSILPSWKQYPKRSKSIVATTNSSTASGYGTRYRLFPINDPLIALCPTSDIWESFRNVVRGELYAFNGGFSHLQDALLLPMSDNIETITKTLFIMDLIWKYIKKNFNKISELTAMDMITDLKINGFYNSIKTNDSISDVLTHLVTLIVRTNIFHINIVNDYNDFTSFLDTVMSPENNGFELVRLSSLKKEYTVDREIWFSEKTYCVMMKAIKI